jgi:hypothetical protein
MNSRPRLALLSRWLLGLACLALATIGTPAAAQPYGPPRFDQPALDSMLAPIALYPDPLLSQVLMAATYPQEVDEAARWLRARPGLSGDAAVRSSEGWDWDPSVRSLLAFPLVLQSLADYPSWTRDLGEAFLVQHEDVMDAIQHLRRRALAAGTLRSTESTRVLDDGYAITIEPAAPQTVYVPYYDPRVTYGTWWWPARPPMYWSRWPGYYAPPGRDPFVYWGPGIHIASGFFFGNFVWARREVRVVDVRPYYYPRRVVVERQVAGRPVIEHRAPLPGAWHHEVHRRDGDGRPGRGRDDFRRDSIQAPVTRPAPPGRSFDDRGGPGRYEPRGGDHRGFDRRGDDNGPARAAPLPRAPDSVAPAPNRGPVPDSWKENRQPRGERPNREEFRGPARGNDDGNRGRGGPPPAAAVQQRVAPPPAAERGQRYLDANQERPAQRRSRETRD